MPSVVARILGHSLHPAGRLISACFPRGTGLGLLRDLVSVVNKALPDGATPAAIVISKSQDIIPGPNRIVDPGEALAFRAGSRLFVWEDGDFDPDASFESTVEPAILPEFPAIETEDLSLPSFAEAAVAMLRAELPDSLVGQDWIALEKALLEALKFLSDAYQEAGNCGLSRWSAGWWQSVDLMLAELRLCLARANAGEPSLSPSLLPYASAGLPRPEREGGYVYLTPGNYAACVSEHWGSEDSSRWSLQFLEAADALGGEALETLRTLPWEQYDNIVLSVRHPVLALTSLGRDGPALERVRAWSSISESDFCLREKSIAGGPSAVSVLIGGVALSGPGGEKDPAWILPLARADVEDFGKTRVFRWADVRLLWPLRGDGRQYEAGAPEPEAPVLAFSKRAIEFETTGWELKDGALTVAGTLLLSVGNRRGTWPTGAVSVALDVSRSPILAARVDGDASCRLLVPDPWRAPSVFVAYGTSSKRHIEVVAGGRYEREGGQLVALAPVDTEVVELRRPLVASVFAYFSEPAAEPGAMTIACGSQRSSADAKWEGLQQLLDVELADQSELRLVSSDREALIRISIPTPSDLPWSPVVAAAEGVSPRSQVEQPLPQASTNLLGELEGILTQSVLSVTDSSGVPEGGLFQIALPIGQNREWVPKSLLSAPYVKWFSDGTLPSLMHAGKGPSDALILSSECELFWDALRAILRQLRPQMDNVLHPWVGRSALLELSVGLVENYLDAYIQLVNRGRELSSADAFWSRYPFGVFLHDERGPLEAVLLPPLHPIRLAWLYAAEQAADGSRVEDSKSPVSQILEGWNFPWMAAAPSAPGIPSVLTAVPLDVGPDLLFLGWAMLCAFDQAQGGTPVVPIWAGGRRMPGASVGGLTAASVGAAMRDFVGVHPHRSTLSIDLAASSRGGRSSELDEAVLAEGGGLVHGRGAEVRLVGGIRVFDSLSRDGQPPDRDDAIKYIAAIKDVGIPFEWKRYQPSHAPKCDIRFLEGGQAKLSICQGEPWGILPEWPVRRFIIHSGEDNAAVSTQHGLVDPEAEHTWGKFAQALRAIEEINDAVYGIYAQPADSQIVAGSAAWNVSGNVHLDPSQYSRIAVQSGSLLWEWRPGYLPRRGKLDDASRLNARPYITVAKVPVPFVERLKLRLGLDEPRARELVRELGLRGVGLSSLLAMGHHNHEGALGFFYGFRLFDMLPKEEGTKRLIVPLDAVDPIFRAIAFGGVDDIRRRADLLIFEFTQSGVLRLVPIEIRCSEQTGTAPSVESASVAGKLEQLGDTLSLLESVSAVLGGHNGSAARKTSLFLAALGSAVECGLLITPDAPRGKVAADLLRDVLHGKYRVEATRGILLWFQHIPERGLAWHPSLPENRFGCLFADHDACACLWSGRATGVLTEVGDQIVAWWSGKEARAVGTRELPEQRVISGQHETEERAVTNVPGAMRPRIFLGNDERGRPVEWDPFHPTKRLANAHTVILGTSGSGKTQTLKVFITELAARGVIPLILDFKDDYVDAEFREGFGGRLHDARTEGLPYNPLRLQRDPVTGYVNVVGQTMELAATLKKVHALGDQQEATLKNCIFNAYLAHGIVKQATEVPEDHPMPAFDAVGRELEKVGDIRLINRVSPLFDLGLFDSQKGTLVELLARPTVIRFSQLPSEEIKRVAAEILLRGIYGAVTRSGHVDGLRLAIVIDEAHKVANLAAVRLLLKEARAFGVAILLSTQEPSDFEDFVFANSGTLLALKLTDQSHAQRIAGILGGTGAKDSLGRQIQRLHPFEGFLMNDHYQSPYARLTIVPYYQRKT